MTFPPDTVFTTAPNPLTTMIDGELLMMDIDSGSYFNLDNIGSVIWARLEKPTRFADLCQDLHGIYDAPLEVIQHDVAALLSQLLTHKLVKVDTP